MATKDSAKVLFDTSCWIEYSRKTEPSYSIVSRLLDQEKVCSAGIIVEAAKSQKELAVLREFCHVFDFFDMIRNKWMQAGELSFSLRKKGNNIGFSDCYIAVMAKQNNAVLLTLDAHFSVIKDEIPISLFSL